MGKKAKSSDNEEESDDPSDTKKDGDKKEKEAKEKKEEKSDSAEDEVEEIQVAGYLNLAADCFHNFTDGLAVGSSFLAGDGIGLIPTLTSLFHEIPHEIGDVAILIQS